MGTAKTRQEKIGWLTATIQSFFKKYKNSSIPINPLLAEFCLANNSTMRTGKELIQLLEDTSKIETKSGVITKWIQK